MKILEIVLYVLFIVGVILNFLFIPGGADLLMITLSLLSCMYFALGLFILNNVRLRAAFKGALKNVMSAKLVVGAIAGFMLSTTWIGILFKLLGLMGANEMLTLGVGLTSLMLFVFVIFHFLYKNKDGGSFHAIVRLSLAVAIGTFLLFTSNLQLIKWQYRNYPAYIEASEEFYNSPGVDSIREKRELEYYRVRLPMDAFEKYEAEYNRRRK